jgi:hypothetical protein
MCEMNAFVFAGSDRRWGAAAAKVLLYFVEHTVNDLTFPIANSHVNQVQHGIGNSFPNPGRVHRNDDNRN